MMVDYAGVAISPDKFAADIERTPLNPSRRPNVFADEEENRRQ